TMKSLRPPILIFAILLTGSFQWIFAQGSLQETYNQGILLYNKGQYGEALMNFEKVLAERPDFVYARNYLAKCQTAITKGLGPKNDLEGRLAKVIVPEINFADTPLGDVLDYFSSRAGELSGGSLALNFLYKGTSEQRLGTLITLNLRNVPISEAIKYVVQLSGSTVKYEEHAVVITPSSAAPSTTSPVVVSEGSTSQ
ncbi:MAG: hypothetical protein ABL994_06065, partial [Verrucomicrobiales bacterium]